MTNIFAYGSLMNQEVMSGVVQGKYKSIKATLSNYARFKVRGRVYPGIKYQQNSTTQGILYFDVSPEDVNRLDRFQDEGEQYIKTTVVVTNQNKQKIETKVYVYNHIDMLLNQEWNVQEFMENHSHQFAQSHKQQLKQQNIRF